MARSTGLGRFVLKSAGLFWFLALVCLIAYRSGYEGAIHAAGVFIVVAVFFTVIALLFWSQS
jgi:hypothetical protein